MLFCGSSFCADVDLLQLYLERVIFTPGWPLPLLAGLSAEEIDYLLEGRDFELVTADHLGHKAGHFTVICCPQYLPLAVLPHQLHVLLAFFLRSDSFFFFPTQQPVGNESQMKNHGLPELLRPDINPLVLLRPNHFRLMGCDVLGLPLRLHERLVVDYFETVAVEEDPFRYDDKVRHNLYQFSKTFEEIGEELDGGMT